MPALTADHVARTYGSVTVLKDVSLAVGLTEKVGLVGANGSGKSTLGRILAGVEDPDSGVVARRRELDFAYLSQEPALDLGLTAWQTVERGMARWRAAVERYEAISDRLMASGDEAESLIDEQTRLALEIEQFGGWDPGHRIRAMLSNLGVTRTDQRVGEMSGGERRRVALARILVSAPGMAVLDEPTNHLDADTSEWLERYLRDEFQGALLLITHDRYFLDHVVTRVLELDRGEVYSYDGSYSTYLQSKAERLEHEARTEARRLNLLRREREWLARGPKARTTKQKARIQRAGEMEEVVVQARRNDDVTSLQAGSTRLGKRILELKNLGKRFGSRQLFEGLELTMTPGDRMGVVGRNGAGKTTLVKMILGEEAPTSGEVVLGQNTKISYFDQGRVTLQEDRSIYDNLYEGSDKVRVGERWMDLRAYLENFLFDPYKQRQLVGSLSGGERARVALAMMLRGDANLLILDEPTNDLDLPTLGSLEEMLIDWPGCAIIVTHDRYFLNRVVTSILAFEGDGRVLHYPGDWDNYRALRETNARTIRPSAIEDESAERARARRTTAREEGGAKSLSFAEKRELEALPGEIDVAERTLKDLERTLGDPLFYADHAAEVASTMARADDLRGKLERMLERWEDLERRREVK